MALGAAIQAATFAGLSSGVELVDGCYVAQVGGARLCTAAACAAHRSAQSAGLHWRQRTGTCTERRPALAAARRHVHRAPPCTDRGSLARALSAGPPPLRRHTAARPASSRRRQQRRLAGSREQPLLLWFGGRGRNLPGRQSPQQSVRRPAPAIGKLIDTPKHASLWGGARPGRSKALATPSTPQPRAANARNSFDPRPRRPAGARSSGGSRRQTGRSAPQRASGVYWPGRWP